MELHPADTPNVTRYVPLADHAESLDRSVEEKSREKRKSEYALSLDELSEVISSGERVDDELDLQELTDAIEKYLRTLSDSARRAFVMRYFFADPVKKIARSLGMGEGAVKSSLHRTRLGLREHLIKEGFEI